MILLVAALSMRLIAARNAASSSSVPTAATAFFTRVRTSDLTALLRSRVDHVLLVALDLALDVCHEIPRSQCADDSSGGLDKASRPFATPFAKACVNARRVAFVDRGHSSTSVDSAKSAPFSIIAHIDHGKSTLSDRILEITGAVDPRLMRAQYLDSMDIERERGITIKAQNVRVNYAGHIIQLIDTPGHVDFGYEVSRSLAACEGAVLLVDASQGIQAQTLANCYQALEHNLEIVAVLNKIDLPAADPERCNEELERVLGLPADESCRSRPRPARACPNCSTRSSRGSRRRRATPTPPLQALIFDSYYDQYRGVISSIRIVDGTLRDDARVRMHAGR